MTDKHYDVVVLGRSLGALVSAALLARRDFRVLLLGQGQRPPSYRWGRHVLRRSAFSMLFGSSPAWKRVLVELAQTQTFRRRTLSLDPMVQVLLDGKRIDLPPDAQLFEREIEREFPEVRRIVDELYERLAKTNAALDAIVERDIVWPPGTFWERREAARFVQSLPYTKSDGAEGWLADLPARHSYRALASALVAFASDLTLEAVPPLAKARLHGSWTRGMNALARGEDELSEFLIERIHAHGGTCLLGDKATRIEVDRRGVTSFLIDGEASLTGAAFVVSDGTGEQLAELSRGRGILKRAEREWPTLRPARSRFVMTVVLRSDGVPDPLGREAIIVAPNERAKSLHVVRMPPEDDPDAPPDARGETSLVIEALLPYAPAGEPLDGIAREQILETLRTAFPFIDRHIVIIDSPHDGRPLWHYERPGEPHYIERTSLVGASPHAEPMVPQWRAEGESYLALSAEPVRGPIARTMLVGSTVLPALGQEGALVAAWSAARLITRADGQRERMRRAMWSKIELG